MLNTIFHQDCIAGMREHLPDACVDVIVTSPPYNIGVAYNTHRDDMPFADYLDWMGELAVECRRVLKDEGYISDFKVVDEGPHGFIRVYLKYGPEGEKVVTEITRVSKPSRRVYRGVEKLPRVRNGLGIAVVSTPKGILSDRECRRERVGGEVLCTVE